jgi:DNA polymerase-3 subunit gamma/tau
MRALLGLADRTQVFDLFEALMRGDIAAALARLGALYAEGADPAQVIQDLLDLTHWLARVKLAPELAVDPTVPEAERARGRALAEKLSVPVLARAWQMLLKGFAEVHSAPTPLAAAEMLLVRLTHATTLPTPAELVSALADGGGPNPPGPSGPSRTGSGGGPATSGTAMRAMPTSGGPAHALRTEAPTAVAPVLAQSQPQSFTEVVALFESKREAILHAHLTTHVHLVSFEVGRIEFRPTRDAPRDLATRIMELLQRWTGRRWIVAISGEPGAPSLSEQATTQREAQKAAAATHPLVQAVLEAFPGATIEAVRGPSFDQSSEAVIPAPELDGDSGDAEEPS